MAVENVCKLDEEGFMQKFFSTEGRLNRFRYFIRCFGFGLVCEGLMFLVTDYLWLVALLGIIGMVPQVTLGIRRMHDLGKSGWWFLLILVPFVNFFFALYILFKKGTEGENEYGPDPLAEQ